MPPPVCAPGRSAQRDYLRVPHRRLAGAVEDALLHYWIGMRTFGSGLPVDGWHVAQRMAEALESVKPEVAEALEGGTRGAQR